MIKDSVSKTKDPTEETIIYYDRQGKPIYDTLKWGKLLGDKDYKVLAQKRSPNGRYFISTIWIGLDHSFLFMGKKANPNPLIFETMVFDRNDPEYEQSRSSTEAAAFADHKRMLKTYRRKLSWWLPGRHDTFIVLGSGVGGTIITGLISLALTRTFAAVHWWTLPLNIFAAILGVWSEKLAARRRKS